MAIMQPERSCDTSWLLLGLSGMGYVFGVHALWVMVGEVLGVAFAWIFMARRFKVYTDKYNSITVPDFLEDRFNDTRHIMRVISAIILLPMVTSYVAAQLMASGKAFKAFLGIDYVTGIIIGLIIILFYTVIGGITAVARADFFHGLLMLMGLIALPIVAIVHCGGFSPMVESLRSIDPNLLKLAGRLAFMGSPQLFVRYLAARDQKELIYGKYVAILFIIIVDTGAVLTGMAGRVLFTSLKDQEDILPTIASELFPALFTGLFIAIVLAAIISTVDSLLILLSSSIIRDVYQKVFRPDAPQKRLVFMGKIITVIVGIAAFCIGAAFCPVMILSLFWKKMTKAGAIAGMCSGFLITMIWAIFFKSSTNLYEMVPGFFGGIIIIVLVSLFTQPPQKAAQDLESVSETVKKYKV
jgi:sodium/proline symporter